MNEKPQFLKGLFSIRRLSSITASRHSLVAQLSSSRQGKQKICLHVAKKQGLLIDVLFRAFAQPLPTYIGSLFNTPRAPPGRFTVESSLSFNCLDSHFKLRPFYAFITILPYFSQDFPYTWSCTAIKYQTSRTGACSSHKATSCTLPHLVPEKRTIQVRSTLTSSKNLPNIRLSLVV